MSNPDAKPVAAWKAYQWPALVVALLAGHMFVIVGALAVAAAMIPAAVTAPAGYEEALAWDKQQAAHRASDALGWKLDFTPTERLEVNGDRHVQLILRDRDGLPVGDATIALTLYHHAHPQERIERRVEPQAVLGVYEVVLPLRNEGLWRLSAVAERDEERLLFDEDLWIGGASK